MTIQVLRSGGEIRRARRELQQRGLSFAAPQFPRVLQGILGGRPRGIGDRLKSWDILETVHFLGSNCRQEERVLDLGSSGSEIVPIMLRMGFRQIVGVDLDPGLTRMRRLVGSVYVRGDFTRPPFQSGSMALVTAISAIEHGYQEAPMFEQIARVLVEGGYFVASFDYWPDKLDTSDVDLFGMDWRIFSKEEVHSLLKTAAGYGLSPVGEVDLDAVTPVIHWGGKAYTFAWMALRKQAGFRA